MVGALPSPQGGTTAVAVDLLAVDEARGLTRPEGADSEEIPAWLGSLSSAPSQDDAGVFATLPDLFVRTNPAETSPLGWGLWDIASYAELSGAAPLSALVVVGVDGPLPSEGTVELGEGVSTLGEGEDGFTDLDDVGPLRPLGQPLRIGIREDAHLLTGSTPIAEAFAAGDEAQGAATLADRAALMEVAEVLDERDVVSAMVSDRQVDPAAALSGAAPDLVAERLATLQDLLPGQRTTAVALGWTPGEDGGESVVVYHYSSEDAAAEAAPQLERVWAEADSLQSGRPVSDLYTVEDTEVSGESVVLTVAPVGDTPAATLATMLQNGEVVFASM